MRLFKVTYETQGETKIKYTKATTGEEAEFQVASDLMWDGIEFVLVEITESRKAN